MKNTVFIILASMIIGGTFYIGCKSSGAKVSQDKALDGKQDLSATAESTNVGSTKEERTEEWKDFKSESEAKIADNEIRIAQLKEKMSKPGKTFDPLYEKKIDILEQKNKDLQARIDNYDQNQTDWQVFQAKFDQDMDDLGQSIKNLTTDNK